jgi:hypothetical protein
MDGSGQVNGIIDFGGGTAAAAGTTMNANDTITGTSAISGDILSVSLQNAGGAIGAAGNATAQVNKITVPTVTADVQQVSQYVVGATGTTTGVQQFTYGGNAGSYTSTTTTTTNAAAFLAALNTVAGSTIAFIGQGSTVNTASTASTTLILGAANANILPGMSITGTGVAAGTTVTAVAGATLTLSAVATVGANATLAFGGGTSGVTVFAPTAGVALPTIAFTSLTGDVPAPVPSLIRANVNGNQGDVVNFTYNGLSGSYTIGATNDLTATALKDALTATIPTSQAVAAVVDNGTSDFVTLTSAVAGTPLGTLAFSGTGSNIPTTTTTTANGAAVGAISFGNNSGIDGLFVNNVSGQAATIAQTSVVGATELISDRSTGNVEFTAVGKTTTVGFNGNSSTQLGTLKATYVAETTTGSVVVRGGAKGGALEIAQADTNLKTVNIASTGGAQSATAGNVNTVGAITLGANATTLNINAATSLTTGGVAAAAALTTVNVSGLATTVALGTLLGTMKTITASGLTAGGITATLATTAATGFALVGGAGTDVITVTGAFSNVVTSIDGAGGASDRIVLTTAAMTSATGAKFTNFEILENQVAGVQDASVVSGITSVIVNAASSGFTKLTAAQANNVTFRDSTATAVTLSLLDATGKSDSVSITMQNALAANAAVNIAAGNVTVNGIETMSVAVNAGVTSIYATGGKDATVQTTSSFALATAGADSLTSLTISGAAAATVDIAQGALLTTVNAAGNTGGVVLTTGGNTGALTINGSSTAANLYNLAAVGTGGKQTVIGGSSTDFFSGTQAVIAEAVISGGTGTDTLRLTDTGTKTFLDADFKNVTSVEKFVLGTTTGESSLVVGTNLNALATANAKVFEIAGTAVTTGSLVIDGSTLTAGTAMKATLTVAAGANVVANTVVSKIFASASGADTITVTTTAATTGSTGTFLIDGSSNTSAGITINASAMADNLTAGASITLNGGSGADTITAAAVATSITGGAGIDTITCGAGADLVIYTNKATSIGQSNVDTVNTFTVAADNIALKAGGAGVLLTGIALTAVASAGGTTGTASSTTSVNTIADVYAAIESTTAFSASNFAASADAAGGLVNTIITFASGSAQGTYLVINDGVAGFQGTGDLVIKLVGTVGTFAGANIDIIA